MDLPYLTAAGRNRRQIIPFAGLNYTPGAADGELEESTGLSSAQFPCLSQRKGRRIVETHAGVTALYARGALLLVEADGRLLCDGEEVGTLTAGPKQMATIHDQVCIWPDKVLVDTGKKTLTPLAVKLEFPVNTVTFTTNTLTVQETHYYEVEAGTESVCVCISGETVVKVYTSAEAARWEGTLTLTGDAETTPNGLTRGQIITESCEETTYLTVETVTRQADGTYAVTGRLHRTVQRTMTALADCFQAGDAVTISGCETCAENNGDHLLRSVEDNTLTFDADIFTNGTEMAAVTLERRVPDLTCVCECDNRIWGAEGQTIYASALGDPKNFFVYDGLSTDSFAVAVGTEGEFTGCAALSSTVIFFKEDCLHKILGSYPAQYTLYTYRMPGVQAGSGKSLTVVNGALFYKGRSGVYAYSGNTPELLTEAFGLRRFYDAVGGTDGERYYLSMRAENGRYELYVYDVRRRIWLREDETHAVDWAFLDGTLYYLDADSGAVTATEQADAEESVAWSATLCRMDETSHGRKRYSRLYLRADLEAGAWLEVEISRDDGPWERVYTTHNARARTMRVPILPARCDNFRIRLSGKGGCLVRSLVREFAVGSEY